MTFLMKIYHRSQGWPLDTFSLLLQLDSRIILGIEYYLSLMGESGNDTSAFPLRSFHATSLAKL